MGLQGHASRRAAQCRAMPFCPCYFRVDLSRSPELCWFCVAPERTGHPRSQRSAEQAFTLDVGSGDGRVSPRSGIDLRLPALGADTQAAGHRRAIAERDTWDECPGADNRTERRLGAPCRFEFPVDG